MTAFATPPTTITLQQPNTRQVKLKVTDLDIHNGKPLVDIHISDRYPYNLRYCCFHQQDLFKIRMILKDGGNIHNISNNLSNNVKRNKNDGNFKMITSQCYAPQQSASFYFRMEIPCEWFGKVVDVELSSEEERLVGTLKLPNNAEIGIMP